MISSRKLDDLHPIVRTIALQHIEACHQIGIDLLVYCTFRDNEAQDELYTHGRTVPGLIVTNTRGGDSFHNYRVAYDCVPLVHGKPAWNNDVLYAKVGAAGESLGLEWAGRWRGKLREKAHFQFAGGLTIEDLKAGKVPQCH
jgi:peptidoglycan L-alanyl-D-glutamate endopeptidase CwlK